MTFLIKCIVFLVILSIGISYVYFQDLDILANQSFYVKLAVTLIAGIFYTSFLTTPLAIALFFVLASSVDIYLLTLVAGFGAVIGDLLIVKFFRTIFRAFSFSNNLNLFKKIRLYLKSYHLDLLIYLFGMIVIISPFPDELGLALLGISKLSYFKLAILTYILNSIGIFVIVFTAKAIL